MARSRSRFDELLPIAVAVAIAIVPSRAHASPFEDLDLRVPVRVGFGYTRLTRGPVLSASIGAEVDFYPITRRLWFNLAFDFDGSSRLDLSSDDPRSSFSALGFGAGLFYVTEGSIGLGIESTTSLVLDQNTLVGGGFATRMYLYPFYMRFEDAARHRTGRTRAWVESAISLWVIARADWTNDGNGSTLAAGVSLDFARLFFLPYVELLSKKIH